MITCLNNALFFQKCSTAAWLFFLSYNTIAAQITDTDKDLTLDLGLRLQAISIQSNSPLVDEHDKLNHKLRRARIRLALSYDDWLSAFYQSGYKEGSATTTTGMSVVDAYIHLHRHKAFQFYIGQHMAPALRQNISSSATLLAVDRPSISYKSVTWGTRARAQFTNTTLHYSDAGLRGDTGARDMGITFWGTRSLGEQVHLKYYLGSYDGSSFAESERHTVRLHINTGDAERGYFNAANYLGAKTTASVGFSYDTQRAVAKELESAREIDYALLSTDFFIERALGMGSYSVEAAYIALDLDNALTLATHALDSPIASNTGLMSQGDGFYLQSSYYRKQWQPWVLYEKWESDDPFERGSFSSTRVGLSYYFSHSSTQAQRANVKVGYEILNEKNARSDGLTSGLGLKTNTFVVGFFIDF